MTYIQELSEQLIMLLFITTGMLLTPMFAPGMDLTKMARKRKPKKDGSNKGTTD